MNKDDMTKGLEKLLERLNCGFFFTTKELENISTYQINREFIMQFNNR